MAHPWDVDRARGKAISLYFPEFFSCIGWTDMLWIRNLEKQKSQDFSFIWVALSLDRWSCGHVRFASGLVAHLLLVPQSFGIIDHPKLFNPFIPMFFFFFYKICFFGEFLSWWYIIVSQFHMMFTVHLHLFSHGTSWHFKVHSFTFFLHTQSAPVAQLASYRCTTMDTNLFWWAITSAILFFSEILPYFHQFL